MVQQLAGYLCALNSLEVFRVAAYFPVNETMQVVQYHVFVRLDLLVGEDYAQVDAGRVHLVLVLYWVSQALQIKVML